MVTSTRLPPAASAYPAPPLTVSEWFNTPEPITLEGLRGQVVVIEAFQMLCPGCVAHGLPLVKKVASAFRDDLVVLGLHTVFEHHDAMKPVSLKAFLHEYGIRFPVGVDAYEGSSRMPVTMTRYGLQGTPSLLVVDRAGGLRIDAFGQVDEMLLGAALARLIDEPAPADTTATA